MESSQVDYYLRQAAGDLLLSPVCRDGVAAEPVSTSAPGRPVAGVDSLCSLCCCLVFGQERAQIVGKRDSNHDKMFTWVLLKSARDVQHL